MSRVERTETRNERSGSQPAQRDTRPRDPKPGHTPGKAEGEVADVEEALKHQKE